MKKIGFLSLVLSLLMINTSFAAAGESWFEMIDRLHAQKSLHLLKSSISTREERLSNINEIHNGTILLNHVIQLIDNEELCIQVLTILLSHGADINKKDSSGITALLTAIDMEKHKVVCFLNKKCSNPHIPVGFMPGKKLQPVQLIALSHYDEENGLKKIYSILLEDDKVLLINMFLIKGQFEKVFLFESLGTVIPKAADIKIVGDLFKIDSQKAFNSLSQYEAYKEHRKNK